MKKGRRYISIIIICILGIALMTSITIILGKSWYCKKNITIETFLSDKSPEEYTMDDLKYLVHNEEFIGLSVPQKTAILEILMRELKNNDEIISYDFLIKDKPARVYFEEKTVIKIIYEYEECPEYF